MIRASGGGCGGGRCCYSYRILEDSMRCCLWRSLEQFCAQFSAWLLILIIRWCGQKIPTRGARTQGLRAGKDKWGARNRMNRWQKRMETWREILFTRLEKELKESYKDAELHCAPSLSHVWLFVTSWTVARQAPRSIGFSRQEYWSGFQCPPPGNLPDPGIKPISLMSPALAGGFFTTSTT